MRDKSIERDKRSFHLKKLKDKTPQNCYCKDNHYRIRKVKQLSLSLGHIKVRNYS